MPMLRKLLQPQPLLKHKQRQKRDKPNTDAQSSHDLILRCLSVAPTCTALIPCVVLNEESQFIANRTAQTTACQENVRIPSEFRPISGCNELGGASFGCGAFEPYISLGGARRTLMKLSRRLIRLLSLLLVGGDVPEHKRTP